MDTIYLAIKAASMKIKVSDTDKALHIIAETAFNFLLQEE